MHGDFGHFTRVLINVGLACGFTEFILLDVELHSENLPAFCSACKSISHVISFCRLVTSHLENINSAKRISEAAIAIF